MSPYVAPRRRAARGRHLFSRQSVRVRRARHPAARPLVLHGDIHHPQSRIRRINKAPTSVEVGDLKPGHSGEAYLGINQLANYRQGITNTATLVNKYLKPHKESWSVTPSNMSSLTIPGILTTPSSTRGYWKADLAVYRNGKTKVVPDAGLKGSMVVYKSNLSGIWVYEWVPESLPASSISGKCQRHRTSRSWRAAPRLCPHRGMNAIRLEYLRTNVPSRRRRVLRRPEQLVCLLFASVTVAALHQLFRLGRSLMQELR